jgi:proteasome assembly chaperone (PAC2) family protein
MEHIRVTEEPSGTATHIVTAFKGWPDAGEGASSAIRYLLRKLQAKKFADVDPEEFFDFTQIRPQVSINSEGARIIKWPANELYFAPGKGDDPGLMFFLGVEPNLKWKTFSAAILEAAQSRGVTAVVHVGALLDAVPHTREVRITGSSNGAQAKEEMESYNIVSSNYQGPTGIASAMMETCTERGLSYTTMWGHTPHYLQAAPNYRIGYTLVSNLKRILGFHVELDELNSAAQTFDREVEKAVSRDSQIGAYVQKLEERYDEADIMSRGDMPRADELVKELEEFLKDQQRRDGGG